MKLDQAWVIFTDMMKKDNLYFFLHRILKNIVEKYSKDIEKVVKDEKRRTNEHKKYEKFLFEKKVNERCLIIHGISKKQETQSLSLLYYAFESHVPYQFEILLLIDRPIF